MSLRDSKLTVELNSSFGYSGCGEVRQIEMVWAC